MKPLFRMIGIFSEQSQSKERRVRENYATIVRMGFIVGALNGLAVSIQNAIFKKLKTTDPIIINWFRFGFGAVALAILVPIFNYWSMPSWQVIAIAGLVTLPLELFQSQYFVKAYQHSPQSLVGPLFSLTAILLVPLGYVVNHEIPSLLGFIGIMSVVIGPFILGMQTSMNPFTSYKNVFKQKGSQYMLIACFFSALAVTLTKFAYNYASPLVYAFYVTFFLFIFLSLRLLYQKINPMPFLKESRGELLLVSGIIYSISIVLHYIGLSLLISAYYISIKRLSTVFDVFFGSYMFNEKHISVRLLGALSMIVGVALIAIG